MFGMVTRGLLTGLLAGALVALAGTAGADANWKQTTNSKATKLEQCVRRPVRFAAITWIC